MGQKSSLMLQDEEIKQISGETGFSPPQIEKLYSRFTQLDRSSCGSLSKTDLLSIPELAINPLCDRLIEMFIAEGVEDERINFRQFTLVLAAFRSNQQQKLDDRRASKQNVAPHNQKQRQQRPHYLEHSAESDEAKSSSDDNVADPRQSATTTRRHNQRRRQLRPTGAGGRPRGESQPKPVGCMSQEVTNLNESLSRRLYFVFKIYDNDNDGRISFTDLRSILKLMVGNYIEDVQLDKIATRAFVEVDQDNDGFIEFGEFCKVFANKDMEDKLRVKFF